MKQYSGQIRCRKFLSYSGIEHKNKWKLTPYRYTTFNQDSFVKMAAEDAGITEEQMNAALKAYQSQFRQLLLNGHSINMGSLGTFRLSMSAKTVENADDLTAELIRRLRVIYTPSVQIKDGMKAINHIVDDVQYIYSEAMPFILNHRLPLPCTYMGLGNLKIVGPTTATAASFANLWFELSDGTKLEPEIDGNTVTFMNNGKSLVFTVLNGNASVNWAESEGFTSGDILSSFGGEVK